jgi:DsbC/DsbD-like thiol-disulfide interchange protein
MTRRILTGGLAALLTAGVFAVAWQTGEAGAKKSDSEVKVKAVAGPAEGGKKTIKLTLDISKGWHVYANPVGNEDLTNAQTVVEVKANGKPVAAKVDYPRGKVHKDKLVGDYQIYENTVTIPVQVAAPGPVEISVRVQACDARKCLLPATVKVRVP